MADPVYRRRSHESAEYLAVGDIVEVTPGVWVTVASVDPIRPDSDGVRFVDPTGGHRVLPLESRWRWLRPDDYDRAVAELEAVRA